MICVKAKVFFVATHPGLPPIRGVYGDMYPANRMCSPRYTNVWRSNKTDIMDGTGSIGLLDVELTKLCSLVASSDTPPEKLARTGLARGEVLVSSVQSKMFAKNE